MIKSREIYLDHASSALANSANPSAIHELGVREKNKLEETRSFMAQTLGARAQEVIFTSGATESNNLAILGLVNAFWANTNYASQTCLLCSKSDLHSSRSNLGKADRQILHIVTSNIEHSSVLEVCRHLEKTGQAEVTYVPVEKNGIVDPKKVGQALRPNTILVSVMYANNEIGTIQPLQEIAKEIRRFRKTQNYGHPMSTIFPFFHTDAAQAISYLPIKVEKLGVDLMSFSGGKISSDPNKIGVLYKKTNVPLSPIMWGGGQEFGLRPGTENVSAIVNLARALKIVEKNKDKEVKRLTKLRDYFIDKLRVLVKNSGFEFILNGDKDLRLPNNINISIPKIPGDLLVLELSARGIYVSEKSACESDKVDSHVIEAIHSAPPSSARFSLGPKTTKAELDYVIKNMDQILLKLKDWYK
jgi:cysteine desulfurase